MHSYVRTCTTPNKPSDGGETTACPHRARYPGRLPAREQQDRGGGGESSQAHNKIKGGKNFYVLLKYSMCL